LLPKEHYIAFIILITVGRGLAPAESERLLQINSNEIRIFVIIFFRLFAAGAEANAAFGRLPYGVVTLSLPLGGMVAKSQATYG